MEGVIAREREINWSEVHFRFAFKTCRHATQFAPVQGFYACVYTWVFGCEQKQEFIIVLRACQQIPIRAVNV